MITLSSELASTATPYLESLVRSLPRVDAFSDGDSREGALRSGRHPFVRSLDRCPPFLARDQGKAKQIVTGMEV